MKRSRLFFFLKILQKCFCLFNSAHDFNHLLYSKARQTVVLEQLIGR